MKHLLTAILLLAFAHTAAGERNVSLERDFGTLYGTLLTPDAGTETVAVIIAGAEPMTEIPLTQAREHLGAQASRNMPPVIRDRHIQQALDQLPNWQPSLEAIAQARAQSLLADHRRVREAAEARGSYQVTASLPVDVMGVYVLVPAAVEV